MGNKSGLNDLTRHIESTDFDALPQDERCRLISKFSDAILAEDSQHRRRHRSEASPDDDVDAVEFSREIDLLNSMVRTLRYSDDLMNWFKDNETKLMALLRDTQPISRVRRAWHNANETNRRQLVYDLLERQCDLFSWGAVNFLKPRIAQLKDARPSVLGSISTSQRNYNDRIMPPVEIRRDLFFRDTPDDALTTGYHETIHYMLFVLATRAGHGGMDRRHPLYEDAMMEVDKIRHGAIVSSLIDASYRAQPEEQLCYDGENVLETQWINTPR